MKKGTKNKLKYTSLVMLVAGMLMSVYMLPIEPEIIVEDVRSWNSVFSGSLGDLDPVYTAGNTSIIAVWVVNHTDGLAVHGNHSGGADDTGSHSGWQNDSTQYNSSIGAYGYGQGSSFRIEVPHSTAFDLVIRVRANATNAATGSAATDQFNASWVSCNLTSADFGIPGGINMTRWVTHNTSGDPFIYINFVYNGTAQTDWDDSTMTAGSGMTINRGNESYFGWINLSCFF